MTEPSVPRPLRRFVDGLARLPPEELGGTLRDVLPFAPLPANATAGAAPAELALAPELEDLLARRGISRLWSHQADALARLRAGRDVFVATPTASGKSLIYTLATAERVLARRSARALYLFPLKALEQDQLAKLRGDFAALPLLDAPTAEIYDGDTPPHLRRKIREAPPSVLLTTPDMLHFGILPGHDAWKEFFRNLELVVVDEVHTYRGVLGAHFAQVLRRLLRVARHHGAEPRFVACSATVGQSGALRARAVRARARRGRRRRRARARALARHARARGVGLHRGGSAVPALRARGPAHDRLHAGAPDHRAHAPVGAGGGARAGAAHLVVPERLPARGAARDREAALRGRPARRDLDLGARARHRRRRARRVHPRRLPGLGPGHAPARGPGRARPRGRRVPRAAARTRSTGSSCATPSGSSTRPCEDAVLDAESLEIAAAHLPCAAGEIPLLHGEPWLETPGMERALALAHERGRLLESASGGESFAARRNPAREVSLRQAGESFAIRRADESDRPRPRDRHDRRRPRHRRVSPRRDLPAPRAVVQGQRARPRAAQRSRSRARSRSTGTRARWSRRRPRSSRCCARGRSGTRWPSSAGCGSRRGPSPTRSGASTGRT